MSINRARALAATVAGLGAVTLPGRARAAVALSAGQIGNSIAFFPLFVAKNEGYFSDAGLDVTLTAFQSGTLVGTAVTSASIDVGCSVITDVFALLKAGRSAKLIGSLVDGYYIDIIASNQLLAAAKVSRASKIEDRIDALRGKKVGITGPGSGTEALLLFLLKSHKIDPVRDVELVNMGTDQGAIVAALRAGRIDAVSFAWPLSMIADTQGVGKGLIMPALGDVPAMKGQVQGVIYAREDVLAKREADLVAFVRAIARAETLIKRDPARVRPWLKQYDAQMNDAAIDKLFEAYLPVVPNQARITAASYERALAFHRDLGYVPPAGAPFGDVVVGGIADKAARG